MLVTLNAMLAFRDPLAPTSRCGLNKDGCYKVA
jgi:hypothetical protein